jgi:PAS domain S-box-containing protein/TyrR family helix-turn-helix protein
MQESVYHHLWSRGFDAVFVVDPSLETAVLNPAAERLLLKWGGESAGTGHDLLKFLKKRGLFNTEPSFDHEVKYTDRRLRINLARNENGSYIVIVRDITESKSQETRLEALKAANKELNEIIELSADGLVSLDSNGLLLRMNKAYERIVGIKAKDFIGKPARRIVEEGFLPDLVSRHVLQDLKPKNIFIKLKNREVLLTGRPVFNDDGVLIRIVANIRDLTELNNLKNLANRYEAEIQLLRAKDPNPEVIGHSPGMKKVVAIAAQASMVDSTVLICGETGTGKELIAKTIHKLSRRSSGPFIAVNCSALPESLLESELFGYQYGAFTGAQKEGKIGLFEAAQGGTLFLDEVSEIPPAVQVKLLRLIQERKLRRLGSNKEIEIDIRIIAASNRDLKEGISAGTFREDLFYRLDIVRITIPPLRERKEDISLLAAHFLEKFNKKFEQQKRLTPKIASMLLDYDWPGNVRELENIIERFMVLSSELFLSSGFMHGGGRRTRSSESSGLKTVIESTEKELLLDAYRECGSTRKVARRLNTSQATIVRKLKKYRESQI